MRTLKKSLALVLALVMVLGLGVVGASADNKLDDYTDAKDIGDAYVEAVGVMTGLEIVDGMTETTIDPTATYTREQAAKIIAYMVLGKSAADSLTCTVAPFDDVAADRWSAGYISFCVEQGIIDGMTDTTFEPTGTLTGFQWAKMLLSAVGFNAKGEFTGDSWSLNTARVAHSVGLFTGDAAGADHVALQRQQAMLYAFNTLTKVNCVVWSEALGDYIERYNIFADRYTYQGTLGWNVFKLNHAEGIIYDNEGNGADATVLKAGYYSDSKTVETIKADTSLDMMYHAARIWFVDGKTNTGVYTYDLAKTTEYDCYAKSEGEKALAKLDKNADGGLQVGLAADADYEYYVIDNSALDLDGVKDYVGVTYNYRNSVMGTRSETKDTTVIGNVAVKNDNIKTDISKIDRRASIIVLETEHGAYYVYPVSATEGSVVKYNQNTKVITLSDGTELSRSVLADSDINDQIQVLIVDVLKGYQHSTPSISFVLDTHGHYMSLTNEGYKTVAYYTGAYKLSSSHDAWSTDVTWMAQFVDVATGEVEEVPVRNSWYDRYNKEGGYYDITDELFGDATYYPVQVPMLPATTYGEYRFDRSLTLSTSNKTENDIFYDVDDITFIIATGAGSKLDVKTYEGIDALLDAYDYDRPISSITLNDVCIVVANSVWGNEYATVVFAYDAGFVTGGYVFFPKDVSANDWHSVADSYYEFDSAYVNGSAEAEDFKVDKDHVKAFNLDAGFYAFTLDANTGYAVSLEKIDTYKTSSSSRFTGSGSSVELDGKPVSENVVIADVRPEGDIDDINELADFYNNYADDVAIQLVYTMSGGEINVIYVVNANVWTVKLANAEESGLTITNLTQTFESGAWNDNGIVITLTTEAPASWESVTSISYTVTPAGGVAGDEITTSDLTKENGNLTLKFTSVDIDSDCTITITGYNK